jgi:FkbH-like protein
MPAAWNHAEGFSLNARVYQLDWANEPLWRLEPVSAEATESALGRQRVRETALLHWQEHCIECAVPLCYEVCSLYVARADRKCARFVYGIYPNPHFRGLFDYGADIRFRRWGQLEAELGSTRVSVDLHRTLAALDARVTRGVNAAAGALQRLNPRRRLNGALALARTMLFRRSPDSPPGSFDAFVLECFAVGPEPLGFVLELIRDGKTALRHRFEINPGHNFHTLPASAFGALEGRIVLYLDNDAEARVIFTWLDFVSYAAIPAEPAGKLKCVAWDLDGTLWDGTLIEDGAERCHLRPEAAQLVRSLDERGILQTVVSKNDADQAWAAVEATGLAEHFLYPAINWGSKSENLRQVAERLNIGLDTFGLIDDSAFERAEVQSALPMVRVYPPTDFGGLLEQPEFDVPITEMSRARRGSYRAQMQREDAQAAFPGDYLNFLRSCGMTLRIFIPTEEPHIRRCLELLQRTNQLNLSMRHYSEQEFRELLAAPGVVSLAFEAEDRFGHYGIVGFSAVDERGGSPVLADFVLSCRVAQKRVEHAFFRWLAIRAKSQGADVLHAKLVRTPRNGALQSVFHELPFETIREDGDEVALKLRVDRMDSVEDVIALQIEVPSPSPA